MTKPWKMKVTKITFEDPDAYTQDDGTVVRWVNASLDLDGRTFAVAGLWLDEDGPEPYSAYDMRQSSDWRDLLDHLGLDEDEDEIGDLVARIGDATVIAYGSDTRGAA